MDKPRETGVLQAPFPWFGGKARIAPLVWQALGNVPHYVEPFAGSLATLLARPHPGQVERVCDRDGLICNFWRAVRESPDEVAEWADAPVMENELHARHIFIVEALADLVTRIEGDPDYYDVRIAGYWLYGICTWIGGEFASGKGPWALDEEKRLVKREGPSVGVHRQLPHLGHAGMGIHRKRPHLGDTGNGIHRLSKRERIVDWMQALSDRLRHVDVICGDWSRLMGPSVTTRLGTCGIFMDPPYGEALRDTLYRIETANVAQDVAEWCRANGDNPIHRIVLCGYHGEHEMPAGWRMVEWKARGGYGNQGQGRGRDNAELERIWLSPHCLATSEENLNQLELW